MRDTHLCLDDQAYPFVDHVWNQQFSGCDDEKFGQRYIELNPGRAGMVEHLADYRWSSYTGNAQGAENELSEAHFQYIALGKNNRERQSNYLELFRYKLDSQMIDRIRSVTNRNYTLGAHDFTTRLQRRLAGASPRQIRTTTKSCRSCKINVVCSQLILWLGQGWGHAPCRCGPGDDASCGAAGSINTKSRPRWHRRRPSDRYPRRSCAS